MAVPSHTATSTSYLHSGIGLPPPPVRVFVGFKLQSPGSLRGAKPNSHFDFRTKVISSTQSRTTCSKPTRGRIKMMLETPIIIRRSPGEGVQMEDLWSLLEGERIFIIGDHIDEDLCDDLLSTLLFLDSKDSDKPFFFIFNCTGGDIHPSLTLYDTLQNLESPIATHCLATAGNMAAFLLAAGDKGNRFASPHSMIVLQSPSGTADGQADDFSSETNELIRIRDYLFDLLAIHTGRPVEKIHKDLARQKKFSAQEALDYGIIDRIIRPPRLSPDPSKRVASAFNFD